MNVDGKQDTGKARGRGWRGRGAVQGNASGEHGRFARQTLAGSAISEDELVRAQRRARFENSQPKLGTSNSAWSASIWKENGSGDSAQARNDHRNGFPSVIGLGRATGLSRVPNSTLSSSREMMHNHLDGLLLQVQGLENGDCAVVSFDKQDDSRTVSQRDALERWESVLAEFRQLTMAVTASSITGVNRLALDIYEGAADASLLAGNLSFYLACQTRLLSDLYHEFAGDAKAVARRDEFTGYSFLYFGTFCVDKRELARMMRAMSKDTSSSPFVQFAFSAITAFKNRDGTRFISLFNRSNIRQKTILSCSLDSMRKAALAQIICSYLTLDKGFATTQLGLSSQSEFLTLLQTERPDLMTCNTEDSKAYHFRLSGRK